MNKEEVISEGYLIAYITDELSEKDIQEVERLIQEDQDVEKEFRSIQKLVENIAFEYGVKASTEVKRKIMEHHSVFGKAHGPQTDYSEGSSFPKILAAASAFVAMASLMTAFYFWNQWHKTDSRLSELTLQNIELAESYHIINQELTDIRGDLEVLVSPEFSRIILNGTDNSPDAMSVVYWNKEYEEVYLNSGSLAQLPQNRQYQLWAIIDGQPVDAGVFNPERGGTFQIMKNIASADAFAVTIENTGGSESPTLETMQVYGEI